MSAKEVAALGGLKAYVCPGGYLAVNADDNKLIRKLDSFCGASPNLRSEWIESRHLIIVEMLIHASMELAGHNISILRPAWPQPI